MKLLKYKFLLIIIALLQSCNTYDDLDNALVTNESLTTTRISEDQAIDIANQCLKREGYPQGRSSSGVSIEYVKSRDQKLLADNEDGTVAYVVNYDDGGFVVVASDSRVDNVLAFSDEGSLSLDNPIVKEQFLDNIGSYVAKAIERKNGSSYQSNNGSKIQVQIPSYTVGPLVDARFYGGGSYTKYIKENEGDYVAGCVPVATATVMIYAKTPLLSFRNYTFNLWGIRVAYAEWAEGQNLTSSSQLKSVPIRPLTLDQAIDQVARLFYYIGDEIDVTYGATETYGSKYKAIDLLKKLGYSTDDFQSYDINSIVDKLIDNHIIFMSGTSVGSKQYGHAWICDGCKYKIMRNTATGETIRYNQYLHCLWGWGDSGNGYFNGDVFIPEGHENSEFVTSLIKYSSTKIEY